MVSLITFLIIILLSFISGMFVQRFMHIINISGIEEGRYLESWSRSMTASSKTIVKKVVPTFGTKTKKNVNNVTNRKQAKSKSARNSLKTPQKLKTKKEPKGRSSLGTDVKGRKTDDFNILSTKSPNESNITMSDIMSSSRKSTTSNQVSMDATQSLTKIPQSTSSTSCTVGTKKSIVSNITEGPSSTVVNLTGLPPSTVGSVTGVSSPSVVPTSNSSAIGVPYPITANTSVTTTTDSATPSTMASTTHRPLTFRTVCDCGSDTFTKEQEKQLEESYLSLPDPDRPLLFVNKTIIQPLSYEAYQPLSYEAYQPLDLISPLSTKKSSFRRAAVLIPSKQDPINILTPFKPILHTLYYAHRHAFVVDDLIQNYQYLEK